METVPSEEQVREFWNNIWGIEKRFNENAEWVRDLEDSTKDIPEQEWENITTEEIERSLRKSHK